MPEYMLFSVTDQGGGIAPEDRQRAFHRMYRADHPLVQGLGETGVGLSIAKALVEAQGGRIWVDSEMGRRFHLHLHPAVGTDPAGSTGVNDARSAKSFRVVCSSAS